MSKKHYQQVVCEDGFNMSVQASESHYSEPRNNRGPYSEVEIGYPSHYDIHLIRYAEEPTEPTDTVYGYVPAHVVQMVIDAHGGMVAGEVPPLKFDPSLCGTFSRSAHVDNV